MVHGIGLFDVFASSPEDEHLLFSDTPRPDRVCEPTAEVRRGISPE
jgi:hypothetical protein